MHGDPASDAPGLISMMVADLFQRVALVEQTKSTVTVSFVEMYNDKIFDLLVPKKVEEVSLRIREHKTNGPFVDGVSVHEIESPAQFEELHAQACKKMRTAPTEISKSSSRSHTVVTISWDTVEALTKKSRKMVGYIYLCERTSPAALPATCLHWGNG
jgi:hypothetical protein